MKTKTKKMRAQEQILENFSLSLSLSRMPRNRACRISLVMRRTVAVVFGLGSVLYVCLRAHSVD